MFGAGFIPSAYLVTWEVSSSPTPAVAVRFRPVRRLGERLLLGSGRFMDPAPDSRYVWPNQLPRPPLDPLQGYSLPAGEANLPEKLVDFAELPDARAASDWR